MKFEKQFPSLKGKVNCFKTRIVEDGHGLEKGYVAEVEGEPVINICDENWIYVKDFQKHCLDKAIVDRDYVKKKDAYDLIKNKKFANELKEKVKQDIINEFIEKAKVKDVIDKHLGIPHMQLARQLGKTWLVDFFVRKKEDIKKELGLLGQKNMLL